jgi:signal transduction histidine kinase
MIEYKIFEALPFPSVKIDKSGTILEKSIKAFSSFPDKPFIQELVHPVFLSAFTHFIADANKNEIELPLLNQHYTFQLYRIYQSTIKDERHLFFIPLSNEFVELQHVIEEIESKFSSFQQEIKENKKYINQTVLEIQKASEQTKHYQNIEKLAAGIAHEIRNPLTTVSGFIQLLRPYLIEIGKDQYADIALEEINRANQIIYEFLNASKPLGDHQQSVSLNKLVKDTSLLYESEATLKNITLITHLAEMDVEIMANHKQLKQVLVNLLKNAVEALENRHEDCNPVIQFGTSIENQRATIFVKDNGCGMNEGTLQNLFLPFHTTKENGTGVGLSVCKKIIQDHGGTILVNSRLGAGTTFKIEFPLDE